MVWSNLTVFNFSNQHFTTEFILHDTIDLKTGFIHSYGVWNAYFRHNQVAQEQSIVFCITCYVQKQKHALSTNLNAL